MKYETNKLKIFTQSLIITGMMLIVATTACNKYPRITRFANADTISLIKLQEWNLMYINDISWAPDSNHFALSGADSDNSNIPNLYLYRINFVEPLWAVTTIGGGPSDFKPDGQAIVVPYYAGIEYFNPDTGKKIKQIDQDVNSIGKVCIATNEIRFAGDGTSIVTLTTNWDDADTAIYFWNGVTNKCLGTPIKEAGNTFNFELARNGQILAIGLPNVPSDERGKAEPQVHIWDVESRELICSFKNMPPIAFANDGKIVASGDLNSEGNVDLWNSENCSLIGTLFRKEQNLPYSMTISPNGQLLAIGGTENFEIWDVSNRKLLFASEQMPNHVSTLLFSPDSKYLLTKTDRVSTKEKAIVTLWSIER